MFHRERITMKKFDRIRVLAPLNLVLYLGALWLTGYFPGWGNLALAVMDVVTIVVVYLIVRRYVEHHRLTSWEQVAPKLVRPFLVLVVLAVLHFIGALVQDDMLQQVFAYLPVTLVVSVGGVYLLMTRKPPYQGI
jgi:undecaprenyl pyrophosphate phosphatase UppP